MVQLIQKTYPSIKITWITEKIETEILDFLPNIEFITFNKKDGFKEFKRIKKLLKKQSFDYLLHIQSAFKASIIASFVKATTKIGFNWERSKDLQWLFVNQKIPKPKSKHVVDGFMEFAYAIGCPHEAPTWQLQINDQSLRKIKTLLSFDRPICLVNPCTSKESKNWTIEGYIDICNYMADKGFNVYLIGGNSKIEQIYNHEIIHTVRSGVESLIGKTTIKDLLALISLSDLTISADTAAVHIANALGKPVVGLYATHDPKRVGPYNQLQYVVSVYEQCIKKEYNKPSDQLPWRTRVHDREAMKIITFDMVQSKIDQICQDFNI
jgi:heptosyltransferase I